MIELFSIEFWIVIQLSVDFLLILLVWALVRRLKQQFVDTGMEKEELKATAASVHQEIMEKLETATSELADKSAVQMIDRAAQDIIDLLDPLVKGSESTARAFDAQIKEKQRLIRELNDLLDSRIISINLLLSRADVLLKDPHYLRDSDSAYRNHHPAGIGFSGVESISDFKERDLALRQSAQDADEDVLDQQKKIVELYQEGMDAENIAARLSMPRGEVELVINLKKKFIQMENQF